MRRKRSDGSGSRGREGQQDAKQELVENLRVAEVHDDVGARDLAFFVKHNRHPGGG